MSGMIGRTAVLAGALVVGTLTTDASGEEGTLWIMGAKGVSSRNGNAFVVTAEYVGPTTNLTHSQTERRALDESLNSLPAQLMLHTGDRRTNGTRFAAGYYRGTIVFTTARTKKSTKAVGIVATNLASMFSSPDLMKLVVAVDNGPLYSSTNAGLTWQASIAPGMHEFPLDSAPDGSGLFAEVVLSPKPRLKAPPMDWYATASAVDGNGNSLVMASGESAPVLSILYSNNAAVITWQLTSAAFTLQESPDLSAISWTDVGTPSQVANGLNQVIISPALGNQFYRLKKLSR